jgi:hypothetical protein
MRLFFWLAAAALPVMANDTLATLGAGGLVPLKSSQIVMEREDLQISVHQITVHYVFRNNSDKDVDATVAFPLPPLEGSTVEMVPLKLPSRRLNFVDFEVLVAGKRVDPKIEVRAFGYHGEDLTDRLRAVGLPVSVLDEHFMDAYRKLTPQQRAPFQKQELIASDDEKTYWPAWTTKVQYYWTQRFPAHATVEVEHRYRPVAGGSYIYETDPGDERVKPFCGGPETLAQIASFKKRHPNRKEGEPALYERRIQYILTTANNWSGPIRDFHLSVTADGPEDLVLTCMPGLKRSGPTRYELTRSNFRPDKDLDVLVLTPNRP